MNERPAHTGIGRFVVTRRPDESVMIGNMIEITLLRVEGEKVRPGITAPPSVKVLRRELWERPR